MRERVAEAEVARLRGVLADALRQRDEARKWNAEMVKKAASGGVLDGYREMGAKLADALRENERLAHHLRHMLGAIDGGIIDSDVVGGDYDNSIPPHKWHEEWAHYVRADLAAPLAVEPSAATEVDVNA